MKDFHYRTDILIVGAGIVSAAPAVTLHATAAFSLEH
jgi:L-2-hydroxyglutarate oxidase LhgO